MRLHAFAITLLISLSFTAHAQNERSICGLSDDRTPSTQRRVARLTSSPQLGAICTATLIGKSCMISAGHCTKSMVLAQFNLNADGSASDTHTYAVDRKTINYADTSIGNDYAVFKVNRNAKTGRFPGDVYGFYKINYGVPAIGSVLSITGHGKSKNPKVNFRQQTHKGPIVSIYKNMLSHKVDTEGGGSGSALVLDKTSEIIGVHTNGGCTAFEGSNSGTLIGGNARFAQAIRNCLASE